MVVLYGTGMGCSLSKTPSLLCNPSGAVYNKSFRPIHHPITHHYVLVPGMSIIYSFIRNIKCR